MKRQRHVTAIALLAIAILMTLSSATLAQTSNGSGAKTQSKTNNPANRLGLLELTMQQNAGKDDKAFGRAQGEYWGLISAQNDFPRAYSFFSNLAVAHPSSPDILGLEGSAIGGYIGWLYSSRTLARDAGSSPVRSHTVVGVRSVPAAILEAAA